MNVILSFLAQATPPPPPPEAVEPQPIPPTFVGRVPITDIWTFITNLHWVQAAVLIAFGAIYVVYGWRIFKALVVINFAALGLGAGLTLGDKLGSPLWGGLLGSVLLAVACWPFMKYSVAVLGALAGSLLGAALWRAIGLPDGLIWVGASFGLIAGGLLVFASYKVSILMFSSLQGSMLVMIGVLALLTEYPELGTRLTDAAYTHMAFLPLLILIPTGLGVLLQQKMLKQESEWAMPT
jgi:hypothetical protein